MVQSWILGFRCVLGEGGRGSLLRALGVSGWAYLVLAVLLLMAHEALMRRFWAVMEVVGLAAAATAHGAGRWRLAPGFPASLARAHTHTHTPRPRAVMPARCAIMMAARLCLSLSLSFGRS